MPDLPEEKYLFEYEHNGQWWGLTIPARSEEEASARVKKMGNAIYKGRIGTMVTVSAVAAAPNGFFVRLVFLWKNWWR
jgi:hypothetical protein